MSHDTNKMAVVQPKRSGVWDYFVVNVTDDSKVSCLLCPALTAKEKELEREKDKTTSIGSSNQPTIIDTLMKSQPFLFDHPELKR